MSSLFIQAPCSVTLDWEDASVSLSNAISTYTDLCLSLEAKYLRVAMTSNLVDRIDSKLNNLHPIIEQQLFKSRAALARTRNRLASRLYRFPEEILSQIFMEVIHDHHPMMEGIAPLAMEDHLTYTYKSLHNLLHVCSVWRNVGLRTAALWSTIPILDAAFGSPILGGFLFQETQQSLERAGGAGLHLAAVLGVSNYPKTQLLLGYIPQFRTINIKSEYLQSIENTIDMVLESGIPPSLRELSICHAHNASCKIGERLPRASDYLTIHECHHRATFGQLIRSVSILRVSGIPFHWEATAFSQGLVELYIHEVAIGFESELNDFLEALASATQLRHLTVISISAFRDFDNDESVSSFMVTLPHLETLHVQDLYYNVLDLFLTAIVPGSHRLTLYLTEKCLYNATIVEPGIFEGEEIDLTNLYDLLSEETVDTLMLYGDLGDHWVTEPVLRQLLESMTSLKTLRMSQWDFLVRNWATLERPCDLPFPKLQNLHLTGAKIFDTNGLKKVVASHPIQCLEIGGSIWNPNVPEDHHELKPGDDLADWLENHVPNLVVRKPAYESPAFRAAKWQLW